MEHFWHAMGLIAMVLAIIAIGAYVVKRVIAGFLVRKVVTAAVTCVVTGFYWIFIPDATVDPVFIGHIVTAILFLSSVGTINRASRKPSGAFRATR